MKSKKTMLNSFFGSLSNVVAILIGLIAQALFIKILGIEYLGINGLFTNIISFLSIIEMGFGSAIIFNLYKPIVNNNIDEIKSLLSFYKKCYRIIGIVIFCIGILICPFINFFVTSVTVEINLYFVFILILLDTCLSYFMSYKRSVLYANQKNYYLNIIHIIYLILMNFFQLLLLYLTCNYYIYLLVKIVARVLENLFITILVNKKYPDLRGDGIPLADEKKNDIVKKVKALFFHKIGSFVVLGTDNIIISKFLGIRAVGLYSNYYIITDSVKKVFSQVITASTSSIGHMLVSSKPSQNYDVFKKIKFINFWISIFTSTTMYILFQEFIQVWVGKEYLLDNLAVIIIVINFFFGIMKYSYISFKEAAGIYYEDRFVPLFESILNIICSLIFVKIFGLAGVLMGTILSTLVLYFYSYPKFVYTNLFKRKYYEYYINLLKDIILFLIILFSANYFSSFISFQNIYLVLIIKAMFCVVYINAFLIILFFKKDEFKYVLSLMKSIILKLKRKK